MELIHYIHSNWTKLSKLNIVFQKIRDSNIFHYVLHYIHTIKKNASNASLMCMAIILLGEGSNKAGTMAKEGNIKWLW